MDYVPYSEHELIPQGRFSLLTGGTAPIFNTPITPRENYKLSMCGKKPFWLPMFTDCRKFMPDINPDNRARGMFFGVKPINLAGFTGGKDMFGIDWIFVPEVGGATVRPGNPFADTAEDLILKTVWPSPEDWDWEGCAEENKSYLQTSFALNSTIFCGFFERLISFMDFENAAIALIDDSDKQYVHAFFEKLTELYIKIIPRMKQYFNLDSIEFHDDWGSQRAALFSHSVVQEMIVPYLKEVVNCVHANDMIFELHSCGHHPEHVPAMIDSGVDCWAPQFNANDSRAIFEKYGNDITIGVSCPLPLGSPESKYIQWAEKFVDECVGRTDKRTPFVHDMRTPEIFRQTVYKLSRQKLCGKESK